MTRITRTPAAPAGSYMTMNPNASDAIGMALVNAFAQRGYATALPDPDTIAITRRDGSQVRGSLAEWRRYAANRSPAELPAMAARYADQAVQALEQGPAAAPAGGGARRMLEEGSLRIRLYPENAFDERMRAALLTRPLAPGLLETVVADLPDSIVPLNRTDLGDVTEDEAFGGALARSIEGEPHYVQATDMDGVKISHIGEQHRYIGAHVHALRRHFPGPLPFGALVAFPLPEYVTVHEIGPDPHLVLAIKTVQDVAAQLAGSGERPVSPQVYWWRPGEYERMDERTGLYSGRVPDLRPVGVQVEQGEDGRLKVGLLGDATGELVQGWEAARR
ncbi:hypothetical protein [Actinomadura sp. NTSP31]|uniref:hypothetical protein n=1 Tax=Actinomadura sp. NTSP31 TaxID=1735447 RepID=UPI0035C19BE9